MTATGPEPTSFPPQDQSSGEGTGSPNQSKGLLLVVALFGLFSTNFNVSVLALVIPRLVVEFDAPSSTVSWLVVGPTLAYAVFGPTAGKLGDLYGRRRVYLIGLVGCAIFAGCTAAAPTILLAILFRTASAVFGQSTSPTGVAIISEAFPREQRVKALGYWGLVMAGGPVTGMVLGGLVVDRVGWRWLFISQVPLTMLATALAAKVLPPSRSQKGARFDAAGTVLLATAAFSVLFAVNRAPLWGWDSLVVLALLAVFPVAAVGFVLWERRVSYPLLPLRYFRMREFNVPMITQAFCQVAYQGGFVLMPLMLSQLYGYSTTRISFLTVGRPLLWGLAGPLSALLVVRAGSRAVVVGGVLLNTAACLAFLRIGDGTSQVEIVMLLGFAGVGVGIIVAPLMAMLTTAVGPEDLGIASATSTMMVMIGSAAGVQMMQTIQVSRLDRAGVAASYHAAFIAAAVVSLVALISALMIRDRSHQASG